MGAEALRALLARVRYEVLPARAAGVAWPVQRAKLLSMATRIGVGESTRFLTRHPSWFLRFAAPGGYTPEKFLGRGAEALSAPSAGGAGLHLFTFNQIAETEKWRRVLLDRLG